MKVWMLSELHATLFICTAALADETWVRLVLVVLGIVAGVHSVMKGERD